MKILSTNEFLERLNISKVNIRDAKLPELRLLPDEIVGKYKLVLNKVTRRYDCNGNVEIHEDLIKDGKLITDFGIVKGHFDCSYTNLTSLEGCPTEVGGNFYCSNNSLVSLKDCPVKVGGGFACNHNQLTSLEGCPVEINGYFNCSTNRLTSLKGCPTKVSDNFYCYNNSLTSLEGCPKEVGQDFVCYGQNSSHQFTEDEVKSLCAVKHDIYV